MSDKELLPDDECSLIFVQAMNNLEKKGNIILACTDRCNYRVTRFRYDQCTNSIFFKDMRTGEERKCSANQFFTTAQESTWEAYQSPRVKIELSIVYIMEKLGSTDDQYRERNTNA